MTREETLAVFDLLRALRMPVCACGRWATHRYGWPKMDLGAIFAPNPAGGPSSSHVFASCRPCMDAWLAKLSDSEREQYYEAELPHAPALRDVLALLEEKTR